MFGGSNHHFMTLNVTFLYIFNLSDIQSFAFLYTDPGSGALVWQLLVASFVGGLFYIRSFIRRITTMMSGRSRFLSSYSLLSGGPRATPSGSLTPNSCGPFCLRWSRINTSAWN